MKTRNYRYIDVARFIGAILILTWHVFEGIPKSITVNVLYNLTTRLVVPFFFICTGFFFFKKNPCLKDLLHFEEKWLIILAIGSIIYFPLKISEFSSGKSLLLKLWFYINSFLYEGGYYHLWFVLAVIVGMPFAYIVQKKANRTMNIIIIVVTAFVGIFIEIVSKIPLAGNNLIAELSAWFSTNVHNCKNGFTFGLPYYYWVDYTQT